MRSGAMMSYPHTSTGSNRRAKTTYDNTGYDSWLNFPLDESSYDHAIFPMASSGLDPWIDNESIRDQLPNSGPSNGWKQTDTYAFDASTGQTGIDTLHQDLPVWSSPVHDLSLGTLLSAASSPQIPCTNFLIENDAVDWPRVDLQPQTAVQPLPCPTPSAAARPSTSCISTPPTSAFLSASFLPMLPNQTEWQSTSSCQPNSLIPVPPMSLPDQYLPGQSGTWLPMATGPVIAEATKQPSPCAWIGASPHMVSESGSSHPSPVLINGQLSLDGDVFEQARNWMQTMAGSMASQQRVQDYDTGSPEVHSDQPAVSSRPNPVLSYPPTCKYNDILAPNGSIANLNQETHGVPLASTDIPRSLSTDMERSTSKKPAHTADTKRNKSPSSKTHPNPLTPIRLPMTAIPKSPPRSRTVCSRCATTASTRFTLVEEDLVLCNVCRLYTHAERIKRSRKRRMEATRKRSKRTSAPEVIEVD